LAEVKNVSYITMNLGTYRKLIQKFVPMDIRLENNLLLALGKDAETSDNILYTYDGLNINKLVDIVKINNTVSSGDKTFIDVKDKKQVGRYRKEYYYHAERIGNIQSCCGI
jgi:hypothetical protein